MQMELRLDIIGLYIDRAAFHKYVKPSQWASLSATLVVKSEIFYNRRMITHQIPYFRASKTRYYFSRFSQLPLPHSIINRLPPPPPLNVQSDIVLDSNQQIVLDHLLSQVYSPQKVREGKGSCLLVMDTGTGKTYLTGKLLQHWGTKTLIITHRVSIAKEWKKMLAHTNLRVGEYNGDTKSDGDVVIMSIDSALGKEMVLNSSLVSYYQYFSRFGGVVFDEVHNYATQKRQEIFWRTAFPYVLGLTATPDERLDHMDPIINKHIGPSIKATQLQGYSLAALPWKGKIRCIHFHAQPPYARRLYNQAGTLCNTSMCNQFVSNPLRNRMIVEEIMRLYNKGKNVFIFSDRRQHLENLQSLLEVPSGILMGGVQIEEVLDKRIIFTTYGYSTEGVSITKMDALILATPRKSRIKQIVGRILRRDGDVSSIRQIIDIVDHVPGVETYSRQHLKRRKLYLEKGFALKKIDYGANLNHSE